MVDIKIQQQYNESIIACNEIDYRKYMAAYKIQKWWLKYTKFLNKNKKIKNVILIYRHGLYVKGENENDYPKSTLSPINFLKNDKNISDQEKLEVYLGGFKSLIDNLIENDKNVYIIYPIPEIVYPIDKYIFNNNILESKKIKKFGPSVQYYMSRNDFIIDFIEKNKNEKIKKITTIDLFSDKKNIKIINENGALYFDNNHVNLTGASILADKIIKVAYE